MKTSIDFTPVVLKVRECLEDEDPMKSLESAIKQEKDKRLDNVMSEMKQAGVPTKLLATVEAIVSKVCMVLLYLIYSRKHMFLN